MKKQSARSMGRNGHANDSDKLSFRERLNQLKKSAAEAEGASDAKEALPPVLPVPPVPPIEESNGFQIFKTMGEGSPARGYESPAQTPAENTTRRKATSTDATSISAVMAQAVKSIVYDEMREAVEQITRSELRKALTEAKP